MPKSDRCLMTWDKSKNRWSKMYKGATYRVTCTELGAPPSKIESMVAANDWWRAMLPKIISTGGGEPANHPHARKIAETRRRADWAREHGQAELARAMDDDLQTLKGDGAGDLLSFSDHDPERRVWEERLAERPAVTTDKTIRAMADRFLALSAGRVAAGELSASEQDIAHRCVGHFVDWIGGASLPTAITADRFEAYFIYLRTLVTEKKRSREYAKKDFRYAKILIEWLAGLDKVTSPKNLMSRRYRFGETRSEIVTFTVDEARRLVEGATGQLQLHLLLMLNCGMYQGDISDLRKDEVDLKSGTITRQRSKTRHHGANVPTVTYRLWPRTLDLLREHMAASQSEESALTTLRGRPWVVEHVVNGRVKSRSDGIKSTYVHLVKRLKIRKPLKVYRKTSATILGSNPEFARYAQFFLGQSGRSVADRHYVRPDQDQFDRAVKWLGDHLGFVNNK